MRVWDVNPGYLSRNSLLGQHGEIHALHKVILHGKKGYARHPETLRWQGHLNKLKAAHDLTVREMQLRGFRHHTPLESGTGDLGELEFVDPLPAQFQLLRQKYQAAQTCGRIPLPLRGSDFWAQHEYSVLARGCRQEVLAFLADKRDMPISQEQELIKLVHGLMAKPTSDKALGSATEHIWGSLIDYASAEEREAYMTWPPLNLPGLISFLYALAEKYQRHSLLHSTIFADI